MAKPKFYQNGLRFECTECGKCCRHADGYVQVSPEEAAQIAASLEITENKFLQSYIEPSPDSEAFHLKSLDNGDCIFLVEGQCCIYQARPRQCRTFPFWPENVKSAYRWKLTGQDCPGINRGRLWTVEEIEAILKSMKAP